MVTVSQSDNCLFLKNTSAGIVLLLVYVDSIVVTVSNQPDVANVITQIYTEFRLKYLGTLNYLFGMDVQIKDDCLLLSQHKYVVELLHNTSLSNSCFIPTTMTGDCLTKVISEKDACPCPNVDLYRSTIGALQPCVIRPNIAFAVNKLSQFVKSPTLCHWHVVVIV